MSGNNKNKKNEKRFHAAARNTWARNPWTQIVANEKKYSRKKEKGRLHQTLQRSDDGVCFVIRKECLYGM